MDLCTNAEEIELMCLLHPPTTGFTPFAVGDDFGMLPRIAVRSQALAKHLPVPFDRDSYISLNQAGSIAGTSTREVVTGIPCHRESTIRYLCAAYVDLDIYKVGLTEPAAVAALQALQDEGKIPPPSLLIYSGRGLWPLWLLHEENQPHRPVRITKKGNELNQHKRIQQLLYDQLAPLGADHNALSAMRYVRMPGSLNTKSETIVRWEVQTGHHCQMPRYSLSRLSAYFAVSNSFASTRTQQDKAKPPMATVRAPAPTPANDGPDLTTGPKRGQAGWRGLRDRRYRDFLKLWAIRGGFAKGCRNLALFYYGNLLMQSGVSIEKAKTLAQELNRDCKPPLRQQDVRDPIVSAYKHRHKRYKFSDQTIADWFDITPEEASQLECPTGATRFHPADAAPAAPKVSRQEKDQCRINSRRTAIQQIISDHNGSIPTSRQMAALLKECGIIANHVTVAGDYKALGVGNSMAEAGNRDTESR